MTTVTETTRYGTARAMAWDRLHQRLTSRAGWEDHDGELPVIEGTLIRLHVSHLPGDRSPEPLWLWSSRAGTSAADGEPHLAGVPAPLRYRTHVQVLQAGPRLDPARSCATRPPPTGGPGSSSPATPSSASPATSPPTCGCPGSGPARPAGSPRPGSAAGSGTSARRCPAWPARRNPANPAPDARQARRTAARPPATTWARPSNETDTKKKRPQSRQVKQQAQSLFGNPVADGDARVFSMADDASR